MDFRIIPRAEWGAQYAGGFYDRAVGHLERWLHHSVTIAPDLVPPWTDDYAAVRELEDIGQSRFRGGISYTFAIAPAGLIFEGHGIGRVGSHTQGHNTLGAGIVLIGNYENDAPTPEQLAALTWLLHHGVEQGWWTSPTLTGGHRDTKGTACPGARAYELIPAINRGEYRPTTTQEDDHMPTAQEIAEAVWDHPLPVPAALRDELGDMPRPARQIFASVLVRADRAEENAGAALTIARQLRTKTDRVEDAVDAHTKEP